MNNLKGTNIYANKGYVGKKLFDKLWQWRLRLITGINKEYEKLSKRCSLSIVGALSIVMSVQKKLIFKSKKIVLVQILGLVVCILFLILFEYYISTNKKSQYFKEILNRAEHEVFEVLRQDFSKLSRFCNTNSKLKLRFIDNFTFDKRRNNQQLTTIEHGAFIKYPCQDKAVTVSINEIRAKVSALLFKEISFDFDSSKLAYPRKFERSYRILDNLFVNYRINSQSVEQINRSSLTELLQRIVVLLLLFVLLHTILFKFYREKTLAFMIDEKHKLESKNKNLVERCINLEGENELVGVIYAPACGNNQFKIRIKEIYRCIKKYFISRDVSITVKNYVRTELCLTIPESDIVKIITSIIFYKKMLCKPLELNIIIKVDDKFLTILFKDTGFILQKEKVARYTHGIVKPYYIMEWLEIFEYMKKHNVVHKFFYKNNTNVIRMQIPINKTFGSQKTNVCYLKNFSLR
jgi:hypothetical protein